MHAQSLLAMSLLAVPALAGCLDDLPFAPGNVQPEDYLRDDQYTQWIIEVDYVQGQRPAPSAINMLRDRLEDVANKDRISIQVDDAIAGQSRWTNGDIAALERAHKDRSTGGDTIVTWVVYLDGEYSQANVAGVTFGFDRIAMFKESIDDACSLGSLCFGAEDDIEGAVLVHEFGHAIGLVHRGIDMVNDHEDRDHPGHSDNPNSVMWWQVESVGALGSLNNVPDRFDRDDLADLCNAGGKCRAAATSSDGPLPPLLP